MKKIMVLAGLLFGNTLAATAWRNVTVSAYTPTAAQTDSNPHITATGDRVQEGYIALSRNLLTSFPYHSRVEIKCANGHRAKYYVKDTMAARKYNKADIFMWSRTAALKWGVRSCQIRGL